MSVLETPRIYFKGQCAWDPITTNNYTTFYNEDQSDSVFPTEMDKVQAFRKQAIDAVTTGGNWNPAGTHRATFFETSISGADLGKGLVTKDPFVASPANFMGMLVDVEPYGAFSSQLFFDKMTFGIAGGYRISARRNTRFTDRYINFFRNGEGAIAGIASVVWQTSFGKDDGLRIDAFDSPALKALRRALDEEDVRGITVQWNAYRTIYYATPVTSSAALAPFAQELQKKLKTGGWQPNPARSQVVGVIGLWRRGEPAHEPCDRTLISGSNQAPTYPFIASAHARVDGDVLTLDLSNSVSEDNLDLVKHDFGDLSVVAVDPATKDAKTLATFKYADYDKDAYEKTSGIVTLKIKRAAKLDARVLELRDASGKRYLSEQPLRALPLTPNLYMNEGDIRTAEFQVYDRGVAAGSGVPVTVYAMSFDGNTVESSTAFTTDDEGKIAFPVSATPASIRAYVAIAGADPQAPSGGVDPQTNTYMYVRTLAADSEIAQMDPTWENVYAHVLANWHAMAPCMDNWLDLGNEQQVLQFANVIRQLTDEAAFEHFRFMPVTRDMTAGRRALLYKYLNANATANALPAAPAKEAKPLVLAAAVPEEKPELVSFAKLSRKMRVDTD